jgi:hypothetical protein
VLAIGGDLGLCINPADEGPRVRIHLPTSGESGANLIFGDECHRWPSGISPTPTQRRFRTPMLAITKIICDRIRPLMACGHFMEG